jgi:hypothetical protein
MGEQHGDCPANGMAHYINRLAREVGVNESSQMFDLAW